VIEGVGTILIHGEPAELGRSLDYVSNT
jgi:hypothetical protein